MNPQRKRLLVLFLLVVAIGIGWKMLHREPTEPSQNGSVATSNGQHSTQNGAGNTAEPDPTRNGSSNNSSNNGASTANSVVDRDAAPPLEQGHLWFRATWGSGPNQLAHDRPMEANPEAPMSFSVAPDGSIWVIDQINHRLQHFSRDGSPLGAPALTLVAPQDLTVTRDGRLLVMDRHDARTVAIVGPDGHEQGRLPIEGAGVPHVGAMTGVFADGNDVYLEREHGPLVRVGSSDGQAATERDEVPGRPTRDGRAWVTVGITDRTTGRMYINAVARPSRDHMYTRELLVHSEVRQVLMLDSDKHGVVYVAINNFTRSGAMLADGGGGTETEHATLLCIDLATGHVTGRANMPPNTAADETLRDMVALDDGGILYAVRNESGVEYRQYNCEALR